MKTVKFIIGLLILLVLVLESVNVYLANTLDSNSIYMSQIQSKIQELTHDNEVLNTQILQNTSYEAIASRAASFGFTEPSNTISLFAPQPVAIGNFR